MLRKLNRGSYACELCKPFAKFANVDLGMQRIRRRIVSGSIYRIGIQSYICSIIFWAFPRLLQTSQANLFHAAKAKMLLCCQQPLTKLKGSLSSWAFHFWMILLEQFSRQQPTLILLKHGFLKGQTARTVLRRSIWCQLCEQHQKILDVQTSCPLCKAP